MEQGVIMQAIEHQAVTRQNDAERCATSITNQQTQIRHLAVQCLSNFMPWQSAFSEFYFSPVCWPEFGLVDFQDAIATYQRRQRRFGT